MGDGTGAVMIDGKMQDDATVKQCHVMVELAKALAENVELQAARIDNRRRGLDAHARRFPASLIHRAFERRGKAQVHRRRRQSVRDPVAPDRRAPSDWIHVDLDYTLLALATNDRAGGPDPAKTRRETADGSRAAKRYRELLAKAGRRKPCLETFR